MEDRYAARLADLLVGFGANVQPDQIVSVNCEPGKELYARAVAASAYQHGARFVDISWFDPWVKRARIQYAREETLDFVPPWYGDRVIALGEAVGFRPAVVRRPRDRARRAPSGAHRPLRPDRARPARRPRPRSHRARPAADAQGGGQARRRAHDQLDDRTRPNAVVGEAR